jgi:hypothetical protein
MHARLAVALSCLVLAVPAAAAAQSDAQRVYAGISGGVQVSDTGLAQSFSVQKNFEAAPIEVDIDSKQGVLVDGGVVVRLAGRFGVGFALSVATAETDAEVTASVPHPLFFRQPRSIAGTAGVDRRDVAGHIQAAYILPGDRLQLIVAGGPSLFKVRQTLVTDVTYSESYPFDTATFSSAVTTDATSDLKVGFHAGVDVTWKFSRHVGIGGVARFSRAQVTLDVANNPSIEVDAGGFQAGGGLRFTF